MAAEQELIIGRVRTAHGVRGELKVEPLSGETSHFSSLDQDTMVRGQRRERVQVESVREAHRLVLLKLVGVDTPEDAKRWRGWEIAVERELAAPLGEGEYYYADLKGLEVFYDGTRVGLVAEIWEGGETVLLEIRTMNGEERLVPFQAAFVNDVDLDRRTLELSTDEVLA